MLKKLMNLKKPTFLKKITILKNPKKVSQSNPKRMWYHSIRVKLIAAFLSLIIPISALGFISYSLSSTALIERARISVVETQQQLSNYLSRVFSVVDDSSLRMSTTAQVRDYLAGPADETPEATFEHFRIGQELRTFFNEYALTMDFIGNISLLTKDPALTIGTADFSTIHLDFEEIQASPWYSAAVEQQGRIIWSGLRPELNRAFSISGGYSVSAARSIRDFYTGEISAVLVVDLLERPMNELLSKVNLGLGSEVHLISPEGRHISSIQAATNAEPTEAVETDAAEEEIVPIDLTQEVFFTELLADEAMEGSKQISFRDQEYLMSYSKIMKTGYVLLTLIPMSTILSSANVIRDTTLILGFIAALFAVLLGLYMSNSMGRTINRIIDTSGRAASGDLTVQPTSNRKDELGILTRSINNMIQDLKNIIIDTASISRKVSDSSSVVSLTAQQISASSHEISLAMQEIAKGSSEQASDAEQGVQSMDTLSEKISQLSDNASNISQLSKETVALTEKGLSTVDNLNAKTVQTTAITENIVLEINSLEKQSRSIGKIIKTIDQIADQTNLLALNAAIEAARAGEKGKGFAVVANEVRKLAEQSITATKDIADIIKSTQQKTEEAVKNAKSAEAIVKSQSEAVATTIATFNEIAASMKTLSKDVSFILSGIADIEKNKNQVLLAMQNVSAISEESAASSQEVASSTEEQLAGVEELAAYAEELNSAADHLAKAISKFKVE